MVGSLPSGAERIEGVVHRASPYTVDETAARLEAVIAGAGAKVFAVIDQRAEAAGAGQTLRPTKLVIFGNPAAGTPAMAAAPAVALELPLKILVWADDAGAVWMSYLAGAWIAARYGVPEQLAGPLGAADALTGRLGAAVAG
jgi:uncharacterized protein (DUF302 family)